MKFISFKTVLALLVIIIVAVPLSLEYYTSRPSFCGSCHIMKKYHSTWNDSKHRSIPCVDCHYAPGEQGTLKAKFKGLAQMFSYLAAPNATVRKKTYINDLSCMTANCHPLDEKFISKKIEFTKTVSYVHKTHFDKTIEGQKLHCGTCHQHRTVKKHFEVSKETCFLCHFKNTEFNEGRGKCSLCHEISDEPLQKQFRSGASPTVKPITHSSLEAAGVSCRSCHIELIAGNGAIKEESCLNCHEQSKELDFADNRKLMHQAHVAAQQADCLDCHTPITHREVVDILEVVRSECQFCHPDHHIYQKALLTGQKFGDVPKTPALMMEVRTNCLACHTEYGVDSKGEKILRGSPKACVKCHTEGHEKMLKDWKSSISKELKEAEAAEKKASELIAHFKSKISAEKNSALLNLILAGRQYINIVKHGHGVHNKKYSIMLIDKALNNFEDVIDELENVN